ncbi:MAG: M42 family metallopeptidase [bacterium]|uniref:Glutamyl aminopeptidase, M42 family n=2 Tax=Bacteria candidate phyla TaxID=1783234 RepID=A0A117M752_UNCT6|nr:MAG: Glutamyl aminopeptidase, M42 family [candidate division TA06 bacterium 32_111]KUK88044.1 MAG: Glutamyl aminopeptidase, M42 family [candidate division TA06 bacterium 34_109]MDI6700850.1 M42 family metallopeptidase [bacterium]HAF06976.1 glucanase [candidate division WOR-3 bacterium]HCP16890.1 glucanase [candidate division WOR-3 bacterium]
MIEKYIEELVKIDSPSGFTKEVITYIEGKVSKAGYRTLKTNKGSLKVYTGESPIYALTAHVDTLGGMVKEINSDGTLKITQIGGFPNNSFEGSYCKIRNFEGEIFTGTYLIKNPSTHVNRDVSKKERTTENMIIRLDEEVKSRDDVLKLKINVGDYVFFDPKFELTKSGFVKTRFLDDKACSAILMDLLLNEKDKLKNKPFLFYFSTYEEVGHGGASGFDETVKELIVADMGVVGDGVEGDEFSVSICAKDSTGPYDFDIRNELVSICKTFNIPYKIDVFPFYGSDGSEALRAGYDMKVGLIGPGVSASHGVERTHLKALNATKDLLLKYIEKR